MQDDSNALEFMSNVRDSRDNGYDLVCAQCGCGMNDEDFEDVDMHEMALFGIPCGIALAYG